MFSKIKSNRKSSRKVSIINFKFFIWKSGCESKNVLSIKSDNTYFLWNGMLRPKIQNSTRICKFLKPIKL